MSAFIASLFAFSSAEKSQTKAAAAAVANATQEDPLATSPLVSVPFPISRQTREVDVDSYPLESHEGDDDDAGAGAVHFDSKLPPLPPPQSFGSLDAAAMAALAPTNQQLSAFRMRSLSRLFTRLPDKPLPSYPQMVLDQLEFCMHVILLETNPHRAAQHLKNVRAVYETFASLPNGKQVLRSGRLYSRSMLCGLAADIVVLTVDGGEHDNTGTPTTTVDAGVCAASNLPAEDWFRMQEHLERLRHLLLRTNANAAANFDTAARQVVDAVDEQLAKHPMMTIDFDEVNRLLAVQVELARLKKTLLDMMEDSNSTRDDRNGTPKGKSPRMKQTKHVQKAINEFMQSLEAIYPPVDARVVEFDDDDFDSSDDEPDTTGQSKRRYSMSNVPKELHKLALTELYSPKKHPQRATDLVERILSDILSITSDAPTPALTNPGTFSHANVQSKLRALLIKWSESILEVPTLVQLGYGGVPSPIVDRDEDDVSSWGGDSLDEETDRRTNLLRSQSYTRIANAAMVGRNSPLTDEQKDAIALLAANGGAVASTTREHNSVVPNKHRKGKPYGKKGYSIARSVAAQAMPEGSMPSNGHGKRTRLQTNDTDYLETAVPLHPANMGVDVNERLSYKGGSPQSNLDLLSSLACSKEKQKSAEWEFGDGNNRDGDRAISDDSSVDTSKRPVKLSRMKIEMVRPAKRVRTDTSHQRKVTSSEEDVAQSLSLEANVTKSKPSERSRTTTGGTSELKEFEYEMHTTQKKVVSSKGSIHPSSSAKSSTNFGPEPAEKSSAEWSQRPRNALEVSERDNGPLSTSPAKTKTKDAVPVENDRRATGETLDDDERHSASITSKNGTTKSRRAFTKEEMDAIRDGVDKFGIGNWKEIQESDKRLRHRNAGQVKDKFRNMEKNGEI